MQHEPTAPPMAQMVLRLPEDLKDALNRLAVADDRTLSYYVRKVLADHAAEAVAR